VIEHMTLAIGNYFKRYQVRLLPLKTLTTQQPFKLANRKEKPYDYRIESNLIAR
jgi:hypothetical protein